jgi:hypothetical protein
MDFYFRAMCGAFVNPYGKAHMWFKYGAMSGATGRSMNSWTFGALASRSSEVNPAMYNHVSPDDISIGEKSNNKGGWERDTGYSHAGLEEAAQSYGSAFAKGLSFQQKAERRKSEASEAYAKKREKERLDFMAESDKKTANETSHDNKPGGIEVEWPEGHKYGAPPDSSMRIDPDDVPYKETPRISPLEDPGFEHHIKEYVNPHPEFTLEDDGSHSVNPGFESWHEGGKKVPPGG